MNTTEGILNWLSGGRVLDVATGSGDFISFLLEGLKEYDEIIGIDNNASRATAFAETFKDKPKIRFVIMDAMRMDFPDDSFDTVCISNSLHHMSNVMAVLNEMKRVLKPRGHLVISETYHDGQTETQMTHVLLHHWWATIDTAQGIVHKVTYTRKQITDFADILGLHNIVFHELYDLSDDPKHPDTIKSLSDTIDRYIERAKDLEDGEKLRRSGEYLRRRVQEIGFHSATALIVVGEK
jgi:ubiquinone/menaquinone biosynthesis C-methylase UbiE